MRNHFGLFTIVWMLTAFAAPAAWRVLALAVVGAGGAWTLRSQWMPDFPSLLRWKDWFAGVVIGVLMALATGPAYTAAATLVPELRPEVVRLYGQMALAGRPLVLVPFFAVILLEEFVWRGAAFRLGLASNPWVTALFATLLYALAQGGLLSPVVVLVALVCGGVWSAMRLLSDGIAASIACHATWNLSVFLLFPLE